MHTVSKSRTILADDKMGLITEASDAGLRPGEWPDWISVLDENREGFLYGFPFVLPDGGREYSTKDGKFYLKVFND